MPYTPTSPTVVLCENLAAFVSAAWTGKGANDAVDWDFFRRYGDADDLAATPLVGRQVVFFPARYGWANENRGQDAYTHHVLCQVVERYADAAGDPPKLWTAERVDFVHDRIVKGLRFTRTGPPTFNRMLRTLAAEAEVCDVDKLSTAGRLFYAAVELEFQELVS